MRWGSRWGLKAQLVMAYVYDECRSSAGTTVRPLPVRPEPSAHQLGELNFLKCVALIDNYLRNSCAKIHLHVLSLIHKNEINFQLLKNLIIHWEKRRTKSVLFRAL